MSTTTTFTCDHCGKERQQATRFYNRVKHHFCDNSCHARWRNGAKDRAKDERIRELEAELERMEKKLGRAANMVMDEVMASERLRAEAIDEADRYRALNGENKALERRTTRLRAVARAGWVSCLLCLLWALRGQFGRHLPTTKPDAGELVVCWQGESRTPHIAYVDSLGEWRDADNGEKLEVTKWSRP